MNPELKTHLGLSSRASLIAILGGVIFILLAAFSGGPSLFPGAYLTAYLYWFGLALGCLVLAMIHYLTGGRWGDPTRRFLEAGYSTIPWMILLFVPIAISVKSLYPWLQPEKIAASKVLQSKLSYLNAQGFFMRAGIAFVIWSGLAITLRRWSVRQDATGDVIWLRKIRKLSGIGVPVYVLATTVAYVDWVMSLEADWYSTMFPIIICIGQILTALSFIIVLLAWSRRRPEFAAFDLKTTFYQLGNLLLAFIVFWAYVMFSQFLIVWAGNLPHEIVWYKHRSGGWNPLIYGLLIFHFFLPFFILLVRTNKEKPQLLARIAVIIFCAHIGADYWIVKPSLAGAARDIHFADILCFLGIGAVWIGLYFAIVNRAQLIARNDPRMQKVEEVAYAK